MLFTTIMGLGRLSMDIFRNSLKAKLHHPIKINFFAAFSISLLGTLLASLAGLALFYAGVAVFGTLVFLCLVDTIKSVVKNTALKLKSRIPRKFI